MNFSHVFRSKCLYIYLTCINYCQALLPAQPCSLFFFFVVGCDCPLLSGALEWPGLELPAERPLCTGKTQNTNQKTGCDGLSCGVIPFRVSSLAVAVSKCLRKESTPAAWLLCSHPHSIHMTVDWPQKCVPSLY